MDKLNLEDVVFFLRLAGGISLAAAEVIYQYYLKLPET